jgi:hypothetical protein
MTLKDQVVQELDRLSEAELERVADYLAFLRFHSRRHAASSLEDAQLAALYGEFAEEDRRLAEGGMDVYAEGLAREDAD